MGGPEGEPPPKPKKEVGSRGRGGAESLGERPKRAGKETGIGGMERWAR